MDKNEIITILEDWNFWKKDLEIGISRINYIERLKKFSTANQIIVITGARRSGKSFIMRQFIKYLIGEGINRKNILMINFEDPRLPEMNAKTLDQIFKIYLEFLNPEGEIFVFLDEVQEVKEWEKWVRIIHELRKAHLFISGSNAKLLSQELTTVLTGRHLDLTVFPLSFKEFLIINNINVKDELDLIHYETHIKGLLRKYLEFGSYPEVVLSDNKKEILLSYFDDLINKDLIKRYKIRKSEKFKTLTKFYLTQIASLSTYNSAAKFLGLIVDTVEKFSDYLETGYLVFFLKRFSFKLKEQEKSPRKVYAIDTGLANAVGFRFTENLGRLAENIVFLELMRQKSLNPNLEIYFWKDVHHREVDFVIKENLDVKSLLQICWQLNLPQTKNREIRALLKAMNEFKLSQSLVICEELDTIEKIKGKEIIYVPLWKWLLKE